MTTATPENPIRIVPGKKYRFVVKSAEEAVRIIQERMGPRARVLSVSQVGGQGLGRFLQSPRLEIIASVAEEEEAPPTPEPVMAAPVATEGTAGMADAGPREEEADLVGRSPDLDHLLRRMGFERAFLAPYQAMAQWGEVQKLPLRKALTEFTGYLRDEAIRMEVPPITARVAFVGTPGSGKTTALCKRLAQDVFLEGRHPRVVRLDGEVPNSNEALEAFCMALGVPMIREPLQDRDLEAETLYFDMPGVLLTEPASWGELRQRLDRLGVLTRVLVINAAYQIELIKEIMTLGARHGATHVVMTHLDEVRQPARLWQPLLRGGLGPWFVTHGPSVTEALRSDIFAAMLERTFPKALFS